MKVALWPLSTNVVSANAARPSGAGSATGDDSTTMRVGATSATAISPPLDRGGGSRRAARNETDTDLGGDTRAVAAETPLGLEVVRVPRQVLGAVRRDEHEVLEPHA